MSAPASREPSLRSERSFASNRASIEKAAPDNRDEYAAGVCSILWQVHDQLADDVAWQPVLTTFLEEQGRGRPDVSIHLAVMIEPFLSLVLCGKKTVESRLSANRCAPYKRVDAGDMILLKRSSGPIVGIARAGRVWQYRLDADAWNEIRALRTRICAPPGFLEDKRGAGYATLVEVGDVRPLAPIAIAKRDRRGWVVLALRTLELDLR